VTDREVFLPMFTSVKNRRCLVVGGGKVAARKVQALLDRGALVELVAPGVSEKILKLLPEDSILEEDYREELCENKFIVIAATDNHQLNEQVGADARTCGALVNVVDQMESSDYISPAVIQRFPLQIAISTGGASPALAARIRRELEEKYDPSWGLKTEILSQLRKLIKAEVDNKDKRQKIFKLLADLC